MAQNRNSTQRSSSPKGINGAFLGSIVLGVCILIAGLNIGGGIRKLNTTLTEKNFSDTNSFSAPSDVNYNTSKYLTEEEAAEYLNLSADEFLSLIKSGKITEYVKTSTGYSISVTVLDAWFDNEAYQNKLGTIETNVDTSSD